MESKNKKLRSGYTTGACSAAAAKAAAVLLLRNLGCPSPNPLPRAERAEGDIRYSEIPFPDGSRVKFRVQSSEFGVNDAQPFARASVIKDAGDDPDVTNGAEIIATVQCSDPGVISQSAIRNSQSEVIIKGGKGVGRVTKPGLAIPMGEPAINPIPRKMIREAVQEALSEFGASNPQLTVTISVLAGEELAKKTLNNRLGIVGGISILGTTGIVRPISTEAYTASITAAMDVAKAMGNSVVVVSSGRTSEKAHMKKFHFPDEAYVMMGDYLEFSLLDAKKHGFAKIHLCAQWAKMVKTAMGTPQTHVRNGAIEAADAAAFLRTLGIDVPASMQFNTVRELFDYLSSSFRDTRSAFEAVCTAARSYAERVMAGIPASVHLVSYEGEILAESK